MVASAVASTGLQEARVKLKSGLVFIVESTLQSVSKKRGLYTVARRTRPTSRTSTEIVTDTGVRNTPLTTPRRFLTLIRLMGVGLMSEKNTVGTEQFEFDVGDGLVKQDSGVRIDGVGSIDDNTTVYYIKHRVISPDSGKAFYHVEWEEDAPENSLSDVNVRRMLKNAEMVHKLYRYVGTETNRGEYDE